MLWIGVKRNRKIEWRGIFDTLPTMTEPSSENLPERRHPSHHPPVERPNEPVLVFLTVCSAQRRSILADEKVHAAVREAWNSAGHWHVGRYLIMPDHIHLFCSPARHEAESIARWTAYWKRLVSMHFPELNPMWQRDCWDTQLRRHENYGEKWAYVQNNPVRAGLVAHPDDWPFQGVVHPLRW